MKWTRKDLVSGKPLTIELPIEKINGHDFVMVPIPLAAYQRLVQWASISRTLNGAIEKLEDIKYEYLDEMVDIEPAMNAVQQTCREHWRKLYSEQKSETKE